MVAMEERDRMDIELTAFQWSQDLAGLFAGDSQHRKAERGAGAGKESAGLRVFPLIGLADATTLREPLQALAESWPLRPR